MRLLQNHTDVDSRMLLFEQLDQPPVFLIEVALDFKDHTVFENEVRGVTPRNDEIKLVVLVLPRHPVPREIRSYTTFETRTKPVSLALAVLVESSGHLLKSQDLRQTQ